MTPLGSFNVTAARAEVEAFRAATGLAPGNCVPVTFPMRWVAAGEPRDAMLAMVSEPHLVPVHESQIFEYNGTLDVDENYTMELTARREAAPDRLVLAGTISDAVGTLLVRLETVLRLFSTALESV